jgi:hypothetical protein
MLARRKFISAMAAAATASTLPLSVSAADQVIRVGALKLMHSITPHF